MVGAGPGQDVPDLVCEVPVLPLLDPADVLHPELLVERAGDQAALVEDLYLRQVPALLPAALLGKVDVVVPVLQLSPLQRLHVEVRTLDALLVLPPSVHLATTTGHCTFGLLQFTIFTI